MTIVSSLHRLVSPQLVLGSILTISSLSGCKYLQNRVQTSPTPACDPAFEPFDNEPLLDGFGPSEGSSPPSYDDSAAPLGPRPPRAPSLREPAPLPPPRETGPTLRGTPRPNSDEPSDDRSPASLKAGQAFRFKAARERLTSIIGGSRTRSPQSRPIPSRPVERIAPEIQDTEPLESPDSKPDQEPKSTLMDKVASLQHRLLPDRKIVVTTVSRHRTTDRQLVRLTTPPEIFQYAEGQERGLPSPDSTSRSSTPRTDDRPDAVAERQRIDQPLAAGESRRPYGFAQGSAPAPGGFPGQPAATRTPAVAGRPLDMTPSSEGAFRQPAALDATPGAENGSPALGSEPSRLPSLDPASPDPRQALEAGTDPSGPLSISHVAICREVRGFGNISEFDANALAAGQQILIYAALKNFYSLPTSGGYRTSTVSSLEVRTPSGALVTRQPLGTAVDLVHQPRRDYFLTHAVTIPAGLPEGEYIFQLSVYDQLSQQASQSHVGVRIMADHSRPGGTDGNGESAMRPAGFRK